MAELFRPCVAAILQNSADQIFIAERKDFANSWQFPQGGQDDGETPREALARELFEELSLPQSSYSILEERAGYIYRFPARHKRWGKYSGQDQVYFLCKFHGPDSLINLQTAHPEFRNWRWIAPEDFDLMWLPDFKRGVYRQVLVDFLGVKKF